VLHPLDWLTGAPTPAAPPSIKKAVAPKGPPHHRPQRQDRPPSRPLQLAAPAILTPAARPATAAERSSGRTPGGSRGSTPLHCEVFVRRPSHPRRPDRDATPAPSPSPFTASSPAIIRPEPPSNRGPRPQRSGVTAGLCRRAGPRRSTAQKNLFSLHNQDSVPPPACGRLRAASPGVGAFVPGRPSSTPAAADPPRAQWRPAPSETDRPRRSPA
jgi:hypothetical protein